MCSSDLVLRALLDGEDVRRSYSICTSPGRSELSVGIKRIPGGRFSTWATTALRDGDTLEVRLGRTTERIRLIGIDTPESVKPNSPVECYGKEASARLETLLPAGAEVEVVRDVELRDPYGRLLAYLFRRPDGLFVNLAMVSDGYANQLTIAPNVTFAEEFRAAAGQARRSGLGLWRACPEPDRLFS